LKNKRAAYGKHFVVSLARQLEEKYGRTFEVRNIRRMLQFAEKVSDEQIVSLLTTQLSWTHTYTEKYCCSPSISTYNLYVQKTLQNLGCNTSEINTTIFKR